VPTSCSRHGLGYASASLSQRVRTQVVLCSVQQHPTRIDVIGTQLSKQLVRPLAQVQPVARHISLRHENTIGHLLACDRPTCEAVRPQFVEKSLVVGMSRRCADETNGERCRGKSCDQKLSFHHVTFGSAAPAAGAVFSTVAAAVPGSRIFARFWHGLHRPPPRPPSPTRLSRRSKATATATVIVNIAFTSTGSAVKSSSGGIPAAPGHVAPNRHAPISARHAVGSLNN